MMICFTLPYAQFPVERALAGIARAGFRHVALWPFHAGERIFGPTSAPEEITALAAAITSHELTPYLVSAGLQPRLAEEDGLSSFQREIELAGLLGAPYLMTMGTFGYEKFPDKPLAPEVFSERDRVFVANMRVLAEHAQQYGITLLIKPHTGNTATAAVSVETLSRIGHPRVKIAYDGGNVRYYEGIDPVNDVIAAAPQTECLIVKDHRGRRGDGDFPTPGDGEIDYRQLYTNARQAGYHGPMLVECVHPGDGSAEAIDREVMRAKQYLDRISPG